MDKRRFNSRQRVALYLAQHGRCAAPGCGKRLSPGWHADHKQAWSRGGATDVVNGQALCPACNLKKGTKAMGSVNGQGTALVPARPWVGEHALTPRPAQIVEANRFWSAWVAHASSGNAKEQFQWMANLCPAFGKTEWGLMIARWMLDAGYVDRVVVLVSTNRIRKQWCKRSDIVRLDAVKNRDGGHENLDDPEFEGCVPSYQGVCSGEGERKGALLQQDACKESRTLLIADEGHHAGWPNVTWGPTCIEAFQDAVCVISMTGTPWRSSKQEKIAWASYDSGGRLFCDTEFLYPAAVVQGYCRPSECYVLDGSARLMDVDSCSGETIEVSTLDLMNGDSAKGLRHIFHPDGAWLKSVLDIALDGVEEARRGDEDVPGIPDAQVLVVCDNQPWASQTAALMERMLKERAKLRGGYGTAEHVARMYSNNAEADDEIDKYCDGKYRHGVTVDMVSEGVDAPATLFIICAMSTDSPIRARQIFGRAWRRRNGEQQSARIFMLNTPSMRKFAAALNKELLDAFEEKPPIWPPPPPPPPPPPVRPLIFKDSSVAELNVMHDIEAKYERELLHDTQSICEELGLSMTLRGTEIMKAIKLDRLHRGDVVQTVVASAPIVVPNGQPASKSVAPAARGTDLKELRLVQILAMVKQLAYKRVQVRGLTDPKQFGRALGEEKHQINLDLLKRYAPGEYDKNVRTVTTSQREQMHAWLLKKVREHGVVVEDSLL